MTRRTVILWALGAGQLLAAVIAYTVSEWAFNSWIVTACQVIVATQFYLAGIWVALGRRSSPWRLVAVGILLTSLTWLMGNTPQFLPQLLFIFSPGTLGILALLLLLRIFGIRLHSHDGAPQTGNPNRLQFTLRSILLWTAAVAILFSLLSLVHPGFRQVTDYFTWQELLGFFLPIHLLFTGTCVAELAIVLQMRRPWIGLALLLPLVTAFFALLGWTQSNINESIWVGICAMLWFAISFYTLRLLGYRFGRCHPTPQPGTESI